MARVDEKTKLQALWIFAMFNYLYADVVSLMDPSAHKNIESGSAGLLTITPGFLLGAAVLMETAIAMVVLTRVLAHRANRWANVIAGFIHTAAMSLALLTAPPPAYYIFFAAVEIPCTILIIVIALRWRRDSASLMAVEGSAA